MPLITIRLNKFKLYNLPNLLAITLAQKGIVI